VGSLDSLISSCALDGQRRFCEPNRNETGTTSSDTYRPGVDSLKNQTDPLREIARKAARARWAKG
jgi:hypothetical protein